jgi:hypothetical protein
MNAAQNEVAKSHSPKRIDRSRAAARRVETTRRAETTQPAKTAQHIEPAQNTQPALPEQRPQAAARPAARPTARPDAQASPVALVAPSSITVASAATAATTAAKSATGDLRDSIRSSAMAPTRVRPEEMQLYLQARKHVRSMELRTGPGSQFPLFGLADLSERYPIVEWKDRWFRIQLEETPGLTAWVAYDRIELFSKDKRPIEAPGFEDEEEEDTRP